MTRARIRGGLTWLTAALLLGLAAFVLGPSTRQGPTQAADPPRKPRPAGRPIAMPANLIGLTIGLGLKDKEPARWAGTVEVSEGRVRHEFAGTAGKPPGELGDNLARMTRFRDLNLGSPG